MAFDLPEAVIAGATGGDSSRVIDVEEEPIGDGTGAATARLDRLRILVRDRLGSVSECRIIRKSLHRLSEGRHRRGADDPGHWAYWRREPLAYRSGMLPGGPGLRAPRSYGVFDSTVYLEDAGDEAADARVAARELGAWQSTVTAPRVDWLSGHQLAQRVEVSALDWTAVASDGRAESLWAARYELLSRLSSVPRVVSHGDFHPGNLRTIGTDTVVLDWGTFGMAPVGADLAHLSLGTRQDLVSGYLSGLNGRFAEGAVLFAYRATLVLVGASRVHWMLSKGMVVPDGYVDFLWSNRPNEVV